MFKWIIMYNLIINEIGNIGFGCLGTVGEARSTSNRFDYR